MTYSSPFGQVNNPFNRKSKKRRPAGISRRRRHQLTFETLEDRRVMSADTIYGSLELAHEIRDVLLDNSTLAEFAEASDLSQYSAEFLASTTQWVVLAAEGVSNEALQAATGIQFSEDTGIIPWSYTINVGAGNHQELIGALNSTELVDYFYPVENLELQSLFVPNDEFLTNQWGLFNFGQNTGNPDFSPYLGSVAEDINIREAWDITRGGNSIIGIVDNGVLGSHPDLVDNYRTDLSVDLVVGGNDATPVGNDAHGTAVAGIAGAVGNNEIGIAGVAYEADIAGIRLFGSDDIFGVSNFDARIAQAFLHQAQVIDVYNHSWGIAPPADDQGVVTSPRAIIDLGPLATTGLRNSVFFGRGGLGGIHVFAAGNSVGSTDSGNYSETVNSRYTIGVAAVVETGGAAGYSESSAATLISAPSGSNPLEIIRDEELGSGVYTTDLLGDAGFNTSPGQFGIEIDADFLENTDYSTRFNGTSAAAPLVSGVIALMLDVNPNLTFRDVQHILVRSARQNDAADISWSVNNQSFFVDPVDPVSGLPYGSPDPMDPMATLVPPDMPFPYFPLGSVADAEAVQPDQYYTNGAGFTVSQYTSHGSDGMGGVTSLGTGQEFGYAHGVVDAALAVRLAQDFQTVGDQRSEVTVSVGPFTSGQINAGMITNEDTLELLIPGGVIGDGPPDEPNAFIDYFDEFSTEIMPGDGMTDDMGPFLGDDPPVNTRGGNIPLGDGPEMAVEWIEVELDITGEENAFDFLRISLVSPSGTVSELKPYSIPVINGVYSDGYGPGIGVGTRTDPGGEDDVIDPGSGGLSAVFTTNRHWGERADEGEWTLVFENYSQEVLDINSYQVVFHGIGVEDTTRLLGTVAAINEGDPNPDLARTTLRDGTVDFAEGVTIYADLNNNNVRDITDPSFITGHDGNFFFDVTDALSVGVDYSIRVDATNLPEYLDNVTNQMMAADAGFEFVDGAEIVLNLNATNPDQFSFSGIVYADLDVSGSRDDGDTGIGDAVVYLDVDQNGVFTAGVDPIQLTGGDGSYEFINVELAPGFYDVRVLNGSTGSFGEPVNPNDPLVNPDSASQSFFFDPETTVEQIGVETIYFLADQDGNLRDAVDFGFTISSVATTGAISGAVFSDINDSGTRDFGDANLGGVSTVYLDIDGSNTLNAGDIEANQAVNGTFSFNNIAPGDYAVRIDFDRDDFRQTTPSGPLNPDGTRIDENDFEANVTVAAGAFVSNIEFGLFNNAIFDFGDLPSEFYPTTLAQNGARHVVFGDLYLGESVDTELDAPDTTDDLTLIDDEDGVTFTVIDSGGSPVQNVLFQDSTEVTVTVDANTNGGYLNAWIDFDGSNSFEASEYVIQEVLIPKGNTDFVIPIPATLTNGTVYARFRYGEAGNTDFVGVASRGEVEDYAIPVNVELEEAALLVANGSDFDGDNMVTGLDFLAWQVGSQKGIGALASDGDANGDRFANGSDLAEWEAGYETNYNLPPAAASDYDNDGHVTGLDFLTWQVNAGLASGASTANGDSDLDGDVDTQDRKIWDYAYGREVVEGGGTAAATAAATTPALQTIEFVESETVTQSTGPIAAFGPSSPAADNLQSNSLVMDAGTPVLHHVASRYVASRMEDAFAGYQRLDRHHHIESIASRLENRLEEASDRLETLNIEIPPAVENAIDGLLDRLSHKFHQLPFGQSDAGDQEMNSMEGAFEETTDWRFA